MIKFSFSETKRNTAQNESLGESPLATVSLRFVNLIPYLCSLIKCLMIRTWSSGMCLLTIFTLKKFLLSGNCEGRTSPVHQVAGHDLPQPVRFLQCHPQCSWCVMCHMKLNKLNNIFRWREETQADSALSLTTLSTLVPMPDQGLFFRTCFDFSRLQSRLRCFEFN